MSCKNYTVRGMERDSRFLAIVAEISALHPAWKMKYVRDEAARRVFAAKIRDAGKAKPQ